MTELFTVEVKTKVAKALFLQLAVLLEVATKASYQALKLLAA